MTSLFNFPEAGEMPVDFMVAGARGVSRLEFFAIEEEQLTPQSTARVEERAEQAAMDRTRQTRAMVDAAREEAFATARRDYEVTLAEAVAAERQRAEQVCAEFARDRQRYFAAAEAQVVKLAIAMARRVLAREVSADPMYLVAIVRAALARVQDGSATVLRVKNIAGWVKMFSGESVSVVEDARLQDGECILETEVGRVELGVEVQLAEIERGFAELTHRQGE
jgi:flagellar assembly protein FliH